MEIIDAHANIGWDASNLRRNLIPTEQKYSQLLEKMDYYNISKAVVVPFPSPGGQFRQEGFWYDLENHYLVESSRASSGRLIPFPGVNPNDSESVKNIQTYAIFFKIKGVKLSHQIPMGFSIDKLIDHPLMKIIQDNNLILMIHIGTGKEPEADQVHTTLDYAIQVAKKYPDVKFIFCHLGRLHKDIISALDLKNVYMDTAGLYLWQNWKQFIASEPLSVLKNTSPPDVIKKLIEIGYEDKIVFGSDEPYTPYRNEISNIEKAEISEKAKKRIFSGNIKELLGIGGGDEGLND